MCDEEKLARWARQGLNRRQFGKVGAMGSAAALTACVPGTGSPADDDRVTLPAMNERSVTFATADGTLDGFYVAPLTTPAPGIILWPDIAGLREAKRGMARRLTGLGYAVLVVNPYYRDVAGEQFEDFRTFAGNEGFQKVRPWRARLDADAIMRDASAIVPWLDSQPETDTARGIGTEGYCMGGPFTFWTAAAMPGRVKAAASFHGGGLVQDDNPQSPHRTFDDTQASYLVAIAQDDDAKAPDHKTILRRAAETSGRPATVEVFAGDHGWTVPDSPAYDEGAAERAYAAKVAMYRRAL